MSEIAKKSIENFITRVGLQIFALAGAIVIARTLGTSGKGVFTYATTVLAMLQMANAGQSSAVAWQYTKQHRAPAALLRAMILILATYVLPIAAGLAIAGVFVQGQSALIAVAIALPFALFTQSSTGFFLADSNVRVVNIQQIITALLPILAYIPLLIFAHAQLWTVFALWAAGYVAAGLYTGWALRKYRTLQDGEHTPALAKEQLKYGGQVSLNSAMAYLNWRVDVFLIMMMLGQSALGVYSIGIGIGEMLWQVSRPITFAAFGRIARGTLAESADITATCMRHTFALVLLGAVAVFFLAPTLVPLVYGHAFAGAGIVARVLLPGIIAYSMMPTLSTFFSQQLGQPRLPLLFSTTSTVICATVTVLLLPHFGILGGAIATSISYFVAFSAAVAYFTRRTGVGLRKLFAITRRDLHPYRALIWNRMGFFGG